MALTEHVGDEAELGSCSLQGRVGEVARGGDSVDSRRCPRSPTPRAVTSTSPIR
jgi:hypothetical protein